MKKLFFSALMLLSMSLAVNAQKITSNGPDALEWQFKRCYVKGDKCIVDLIVTNAGKKDLTLKVFTYPNGYGNGISAYDDEGNVYSPDNVSGQFGGKDFGSNDCMVQIPRDVTLKMRVQLSDFDEFATSIKVLKIAMFKNTDDTTPYYGFEVQVKDIPVTRE